MFSFILFIYGRSAFSSTLLMGDKSDTDRSLVPMLWSLFSFKVKMVWGSFPRCNIVLVLGAVLNIFVRYLVESYLRYFRGDR